MPDAYISPYAGLPVYSPSASPISSPTLKNGSDSFPTSSDIESTSPGCSSCDICHVRLETYEYRRRQLQSMPWLVEDPDAWDSYEPKGPCRKACADKYSGERWGPMWESRREKEIQEALQWLRNNPPVARAR